MARKNDASVDVYEDSSTSAKKPFPSKFRIILRIAISLIFALILWGYVMTTINPERIREVDGIAVTTVGDSDLLTRQLVVKGDIASILGTVSVRVQTDVNHYFDVTADKITARVNIGDIMEAGVVTLKVSAETSIGTIESVTPSTITLEVDNLETKSVPIEAAYSGALPEGYYCADTSFGNDALTISGPKTIVDRVIKAVCTIPLSDKTETFSRTYELVLVDSAGDIVETTGFTSAFTPTVIFSMEIKRTMTIPIEVLIAGTLTDAYELVEAVPQPSSIVVAGDEDVLNSLTSIKTGYIDITGYNNDFVTTTRINLSVLGVTLISNPSQTDLTVSVNLKIDEKTITHTLYDQEISVENSPDDVEYIMSRNTLDAMCTMDYSLLMAIETGEIKLAWSIEMPSIPNNSNGQMFYADLQFKLSLSEDSDMIIAKQTINSDGDLVTTFQLYNDDGELIERTLILSWDRTPIGITLTSGSI
ncbi:MAG: hypothetical protein IJA35_04990 [Clostridia bacterium]|nr:hypothetical protein [Clostridia bacterium]